MWISIVFSHVCINAYVTTFSHKTRAIFSRFRPLANLLKKRKVVKSKRFKKNKIM